MTRVRKIFKNSVANYSKMIYRSGTAVVTIAVIARYLGPTKFGRYAFVAALTEVLTVFASMGLPSIVVREVARDTRKTAAYLASGLVLQAIFSLITIGIIAGTVNVLVGSSWLNLAPKLVLGTYICAAAMILDLWGKFFAAFPQAHEEMKYNTYQTLVGQTTHVACVVIAALADWGLTGMFCAILVSRGAFAAFGGLVVFTRYGLPVKSLSRETLVFLAREAFPIGVKRILRRLGLRVDTLILTAMKTKYEVGLFHGVYKIAQSLMFVTESVSDAIFPVLSKLSMTSESSLQMAYEKSFKFVLLIGIPLAVFFTCFAKPTVVILLGEQYVDAYPVLQVFGWIIAFMFINEFLEGVLISLNLQRLTAIFAGTILVINVALDLALIPSMSYMGAAVATLVSEVVLFGLSMHAVSKSTKLFDFHGVITKPLVAGAGTLGLAITLRNWNVILGGAIVLSTYAGILLAVKTFTPDEVDLVKRAFKKESRP